MLAIQVEVSMTTIQVSSVLNVIIHAKLVLEQVEEHVYLALIPALELITQVHVFALLVTTIAEHKPVQPAIPPVQLLLAMGPVLSTASPATTPGIEPSLATIHVAVWLAIMMALPLPRLVCLVSTPV